MTRAVETYNETPAANDFDIDEGGAPPSHQRVKVDDSNRERMSALATLYQSGLEWLDLLRDPTDRSISFPVAKASDTTIAITSGTNDLTSLFNTGRRIKTTTAGVDTDEVEVLSVAYVNPTTTVTIYSAGGDTVTAGIDGLLLHSSAALKRFAFLDTLTSTYIVPGGFTDGDFAAALAAIVTAGGGTILLGTGDYALTQQHTVPTNCRIIGQGIDNSRLVSTADGVDALLKFTVAEKAALESFSIVGNGAASTGTGHAIMFDGGVVEHLRIRDLDISLGRGDAIRFEDNTSINHVSIDGVSIDTVNGNGIYIEDDNTANDNCSISNVNIKAHGAGGGTTYGLRVAGQWALSNISIKDLNLAGPDIQVGLALWERVAVFPNEQDAHHCSVSGISVSGTGSEARGIDMNGRFCSVTGANINLSGASTTGVRVAGTLGSQLAQNNKLSASSITAAIGYDESNTAAKHNSVVGCSFQDCGVDVRLLASGGGLVADNVMSDASLGSSASIVVVSGDKYWIRGNRIRDCAGDGIDVQTGSTGCRVSQNEVTGATGDDYINGAGSGAVFWSNYPCEEETNTEKTSDEVFNDANPNNLDGVSRLVFPTGDGGPDGVKKYVFELDMPWFYDENAAGTFDIDVQIHVGQTILGGDKDDPVTRQLELLDAHDNEDGHMYFSGVVTPVAGDKIGVVIDLNNWTTNNEFTVRGSSVAAQPRTTFRVRRMRDE